MQKKEKFLNKIVKKDYNNELETILEAKKFDENAKNLLLNILYKIEASYKDFKQVKRQEKSEENYIEDFISMIKDNCEIINIVKLNDEENKVLNNKTFLIDTEEKKIVCYPIEKKLLYAISKISNKDEIIKEKYFVINNTLSKLINIGNNINLVEPLRDFNGYSWTTIPKEIESIEYNIIYQNIRILLGYEFLEKWIKNKEFIIDYMETMKNILQEKYGEANQKEFIKLIEKISVLLDLKYNKDDKEKYTQEKKEVEEKLNKISDKENFIETLTKEKKELAEDIKLIDEKISNKNLLQEEYIKRNENLPLKKKIFSIRILSKLMLEEREKKIEEIEKYNELLNPKNFIKYKKELEQKYEFLKLVDIENLDEEIQKIIIRIQKTFLKCYKIKIEKAVNKNDIIDELYEFRYYNLLPLNFEISINESKELSKELKETRKKLIKKAQDLKAIVKISKDDVLEDKILKNVFQIRAIFLEEIYIKITKEKEKFFLQIFDEEIFEEKIAINTSEKINRKNFDIKINKKIKIFN